MAAGEFTPILPAHAIERCGITLTFDQGLPSKALRKATELAKALLEPAGFRQNSKSLGITIDAQTGRIAKADDEGGPSVFALPNGSHQIIFDPRSIIYQNSNYVRWQPFASQYSDLINSVFEHYLSVVNLNAIQLEYWDRFNWSGSWPDFDVGKLINRDSTLTSNQFFDSKRERHCHNGWFESNGQLRRLFNANIDVTGIPLAGTSQTKPSVGVYTMVRDENNVPDFGKMAPEQMDFSFAIAQLNEQHNILKGLFSRIINSEMAKRISLNSGATNA